jgi:hypothetical protein
MNCKEAAGLLGMSPRGVRYLITSGRLNAKVIYRYGYQYDISQKDIEEAAMETGLVDAAKRHVPVLARPNTWYASSSIVRPCSSTCTCRKAKVLGPCFNCKHLFINRKSNGCHILVYGTAQMFRERGACPVREEQTEGAEVVCNEGGTNDCRSPAYNGCALQHAEMQ